jgi:homoserine kinase
MPLVQVPASTTNLGPGFDALGLALRLYNRVGVERAGDLAVDVEGEGARSLPRDSRNLAYRAASRCLAEAGEEAVPLAIRLENRIPVGRGLGSSAAAIVGGLVAANALARTPLPPERLLRLALELEGHPDNVTPALLGGFQVACAVEGRVLHQRLPLPPDLRAVLAIPDRELSTEKARAALPAFVPRRDAVFNLGRLALLLGALVTGDLDALGAAMEDRLHQPYRAPLMPGFEAAVAAARAAGAAGACLSGAGTTVLALASGDESAIGEAMCAAFADHGVNARALCLPFDEHGAQVVPDD